VHRGHLDLATAAERIAEAEPLARSSDDLRFALRLLKKALAERGASDASHSSHSAEASADTQREVLLVAEDGRCFRPPGGPTTDLRRHHRLRRVLLALVEGRKRSPGTPVSVDDLLERAWPGERVLHDAGRQRVYVAVSTLRELGLRDLLLSDATGYLLDARVAVRTTTDPFEND
jgi:hypothetical protein